MKTFLKKIVVHQLLFVLFSLSIFSEEKFSLRFNHSFLSGEGDEIVYRDSAGNELSRLIWGLEGVRLIGIGATYKIDESLSINSDLYVNYNTANSEMDDYDWLDYNRTDWTHWSNSPTNINRVSKIDLNLEYLIFPIKNINTFLTVGFKSDRYKWDAIGGTYIYSNSDGSNFRGYRGTFDDVVGISYNQYFDSSYIGLGAILKTDKLSLKGKVLYSFVVLASDEDTHHLRDLYFEDFFEYGQMLSLNLYGSFDVNSKFSLNATFDFNKYFLNIGETKMTNLLTGEVSTSGYGGAGIENYTSMFSLGLLYKF